MDFKIDRRIILRIKKEHLDMFNSLEKDRKSEKVSRLVYRAIYMNRNERIFYSKETEHQLMADYFIMNLTSLLEENKRNLDLNDIYTLECKTATLSRDGYLKLYLPMFDYKEKAKSLKLKDDKVRKPYYQENTESYSNWAWQNAQAKVLMAYNHERKKLYVFRNWQELSLEAKRQYRNGLEYYEMERPWDRNINCPDKDKKGNIYKWQHCIILHLEEMPDDFIKKYGIDVFNIEFKLIG